jgi:glycosyltransferase involved in cell wall biosynthesis
MHDISFIHFAKELSFPVRTFLDYYAPRYAKKADRIFTVSEFSKNDIVKTFHVSAEKIDVGYNGCNTAFKPVAEKIKTETKDSFTNGCEYFLVLGMGNPRKNIERIIHAYTKFRQRNSSPVKLLLIGHRKYWSTPVWHAYHSSMFKKDILIIPYLKEEELLRVTGSASSLIYVSLFEGFGIPILEAMNCDVPVLASNTSSMPEVCGDAALLVDPYSEEYISQGMNRIYSDAQLRNSLIEKARNQRAKFSWQHTADALWKSVEKVLAM